MNCSIIALGGPPCSGKTETGRELALLLDLCFKDTDRMVSKAAGMSIREIFRMHGEKHFRKLEKLAVSRAICDLQGGGVLALGGGALLDGGTLALVRSRCVLFVLTAPPEVLAARNSGERPLVTDRDAFLRLLEERKTHYESLGESVDTRSMNCRETAVHIASLIRKRERSP